MPKVKPAGKGKIESETITLRFDKVMLDDLRQESEQKMESLNTLINQIVKSYINWHNPAAKAGLTYFSKALVVRMVDSLADEQIVKLAEDYAKHQAKEEMHMLRLEYTLSSFIEGLCGWLDVSDIRYRHDGTNNFDTYMIRYDMGRKMSLFMAKYIEKVFEDLKVKNAEVEITDNGVLFRIKKE